MQTILITNDPDIAADAQAAGVDRIMVDLEWMGKKERQASRTTFLSTHSCEDVKKIRAVLTRSELIVRINPWHPESRAELEGAIAAGANTIMLPMITQMDDFTAFVRALNGRAKPLPLVETAYSMAHIADIAAMPEVEELYIGLNDLHLSLGLDFLFEPLALGIVDWMAEHIHLHGKRFGFGGLAMMGSGELPAERILAEHARLGSDCVILSSRFCKDIEISNAKNRRERIVAALDLMHRAHDTFIARSVDEQEADAEKTAALIQDLTTTIRKQRACA